MPVMILSSIKELFFIALHCLIFERADLACVAGTGAWTQPMGMKVTSRVTLWVCGQTVLAFSL